VKTPIPAPTPPQKKTQPKNRGTLAKTVAVATCTALGGCTGGTQAVRTVSPSPQDCPPEALKTMEELGIRGTREGRIGYSLAYDLRVNELTLQPGRTTARVVSDVGPLKAKFDISGKIFVKNGRLYGHFTELRQLSSGNVYPVCMELAGGWSTEREGPQGWTLLPGSTPEAPRVLPRGYVRVVERFQEE
jgi:hypothetical protein